MGAKKWMADTLARFSVEQAVEGFVKWLWTTTVGPVKGVTVVSAGSGVAAGTVALWSTLPWPVWLVFILVVFLLVLLVLWAATKLLLLWLPGIRPPKTAKGNTFTYGDRRQLPNIELQMQDSSELLVAVIAGHHYHQLTDDDYRKIKKMILCDPATAIFTEYIRSSSFRGPTFKDAIENNIERCRRLGVSVRLTAHPIMNVAISDRDKESGWARSQWVMPFRLGNESPITMVYKAADPDLFSKFSESFDKLWDDAKEPD